MSEEYKELGGVNVRLGDLFSKFAGGVCRSTWRNSKHVKVYDMTEGHFRGPRGYEIDGFPFKVVHTAGSDGVGSKPTITSVAMKHEKGGHDLFAMIAGDMERYGGRMLIFLEDLSVKTLGKDIEDTMFLLYQRLMVGLGALVTENNTVLLGGETAELRDAITTEFIDPESEMLTQYIWSACGIGVYDPEKMILGQSVRPGDGIIALKDGIRANGVGMVRGVLRKRFGPNWHMDKSEEAQRFIQDAATPSTVYTKFFDRVNGWYLKGFADQIRIGLCGHLSGGGLVSKFVEPLLELGFSAEINDLHDLPYCVSEAVKETSQVPKNIYSTFGAGQGAVFTVPDHLIDLAIDIAIEEGFEPKLCGRVLKKSDRPCVKVTSKYDGTIFECRRGE